MSTDDLVKTLATLVLVAAIPAVIALIGGRHLLRVKDAEIEALKQTHAAQITALELLTPPGSRCTSRP